MICAVMIRFILLFCLYIRSGEAFVVSFLPSAQHTCAWCSTTFSTRGNQPNNPSNDVSQLSLSDLLARLDEREIRYSPTTSRRELEELYEKRVTLSKRPLDGGADDRTSDHIASSNQPFDTTSRAASDQSKYPIHALSLSALLEELTELGAPFPPSASRVQLEDALQNAREAPSTTRQKDSRHSTRSKAVGTSSEQRSWKRKRRRQQFERNRPRWQKAVHSARDKLDRVIPPELNDRAVRHAKRIRRRFSDYLRVDDDGVRDVDFVYLRKDEPKRDRNGPRRRTASALHPQGRPPTTRAARPRPPTADYRQPVNTRIRNQQMRNGSAVSKSVNATASRPPIILMPTSEPVETNPPSHRRRNEQTPPEQSRTSESTVASTANERRKRRIYNPYAQTNNGDGEGFDRFGSFVADTAERIMWGPDDNDSLENESTNGTDEVRSKHWKDRLEERFDYMLGIHEDGSYYTSWGRQAAAARRRQGGHDAFSVARGIQPKRRGVANVQKRYDRPIWEEEGNLVSLLFGRSKSGGSLLFEKLLDRDRGSLLNFFRAVLQSFLLVGSYVCRWASVRGALPQPIVVVSVMSAGLSARRRIRAMLVTLILLRTAGELLHGYAYGSDGWEDDADWEEEEADATE